MQLRPRARRAAPPAPPAAASRGRGRTRRRTAARGPARAARHAPAAGASSTDPADDDADVKSGDREQVHQPRPGEAIAQFRGHATAPVERPARPRPGAGAVEPRAPLCASQVRSRVNRTRVSSTEARRRATTQDSIRPPEPLLRGAPPATERAHSRPPRAAVPRASGRRSRPCTGAGRGATRPKRASRQTGSSDLDPERHATRPARRARRTASRSSAKRQERR